MCRLNARVPHPLRGAAVARHCPEVVEVGRVEVDESGHHAVERDRHRVDLVLRAAREPELVHRAQRFALLGGESGEGVPAPAGRGGVDHALERVTEHPRRVRHRRAEHLLRDVREDVDHRALVQVGRVLEDRDRAAGAAAPAPDVPVMRFVAVHLRRDSARVTRGRDARAVMVDLSVEVRGVGTHVALVRHHEVAAVRARERDIARLCARCSTAATLDVVQEAALVLLGGREREGELRLGVLETAVHVPVPDRLVPPLVELHERTGEVRVVHRPSGGGRQRGGRGRERGRGRGRGRGGGRRRGGARVGWRRRDRGGRERGRAIGQRRERRGRVDRRVGDDRGGGTAVDVYGIAEGDERRKVVRDVHRDVDAPERLACQRHMVGAVHRDPADEVDGVVQRPEVAVLQAGELEVVGETSGWCVGDRAHVPGRRVLRCVEAVCRAAPGRDHGDESHLRILVEGHHLLGDVDLGAVGLGIGVERFRVDERGDERRLVGTDAPRHRHVHQTLHGVDCIRRRLRVHAVARAGIESYISHALLVGLDHVAGVAGTAG